MGQFLEDFEKPKVVIDGVISEAEEVVIIEPSLKMSKAELVAIAEGKGIEVVPDEMTKAQILETIEG